MIAQALGGRVEKAAIGWGLGIKNVAINTYLPWMDQIPGNELKLIFSHQDQVVELPPQARIIASSNHCPVSMFTVDGHFLGVQAHPEFTKEFSRAGIEYRREIVDSQIIEDALDSLSQSTDENHVIHWIENFIQQKP